MKNPRIQSVHARRDYTLLLLFDNGEERIFDVKPFLDKGIFRDLQNIHIFSSVKPFLGSIQWSNGADFCPDMLYEESRPFVSSSLVVHEETL